jgi:BASS family bile acid:Na+ symporter
MGAKFSGFVLQRNAGAGFFAGMRGFLSLAANAFPVWLLIFCGVALWRPEIFTWFAGPWIVWGLAFIMLGMGVTLDAGAFRKVAARPWPVVLGFFAQYTVMPASGWLIAKALELPADFAVGLILVACCPGGTASNVVTYIARANVALSVVMTFCSTVAAVVMTPWLTHWLAGTYLEVDAAGMLLTTMQVVVAPVAIGVFLHHKFPGLARPFSAYGPLVSVLLICMICASIVGNSREAIFENGARLGLAVGLLHASGFLLGWILAKLGRLDTSDSRAVSIEVGMQNSGLAAVLAKTHFAANPLTAVPAAISSVTHSLIGSLLAAIWRLRMPADIK